MLEDNEVVSLARSLVSLAKVSGGNVNSVELARSDQGLSLRLHGHLPGYQYMISFNGRDERLAGEILRLQW